MSSIVERNGKYKVVYNYTDERGKRSRSGRPANPLRRRNDGRQKSNTKNCRGSS